MPNLAPAISHIEGRDLLADHTQSLLGPERSERQVRIMVTMPGEAADHYYSLIRDLLGHSMDSMRINCAHDDAVAWSKMIDHLHRAEPELNRKCRVLMDLSGPKLRTGSLPRGPRVLKIKPKRDDVGIVTNPATVWLTDAEILSSHPARLTQSYRCIHRGCSFSR